MAKIKDISNTPVRLRADLAEAMQEECGPEIEEHGLTYVVNDMLIRRCNRRRIQHNRAHPDEQIPLLPPAQTRSERLSASAIARWESAANAEREAEEKAETEREKRRERDKKRKAAQIAGAADSEQGIEGEVEVIEVV